MPKSHLKAAKMTDAEGQVSDDWLADIFNADDEAILSLNIGKGSLPRGTLAERGRGRIARFVEEVARGGRASVYEAKKIASREAAKRGDE